MNIAECGFAIREARKRRGLTLQEVADRLGMAPATVSRVETGNIKVAISAVGLMRIAEFVGLEMVLRPQGFGMTLEDAQSETERHFHGSASSDDDDDVDSDTRERGPR